MGGGNDTDDVLASARAPAVERDAARGHADGAPSLACNYTVLEQVPAAVCVLRGPRRVFEFANARYREMSGARGPLVGRPLDEAFPELDPGVRALIERVVRTGQRYAGELAVRLDWLGDGSITERTFDVTFEPLRNERGVVDGMLSFAYDVTGQVDARRAAETDHARLRGMIEGLPVGLGVFRGVDLRAEAINAAGRELVDAAALLGRPLRAVATRAESRRVVEVLEHVYASGETCELHAVTAETPAQGTRVLRVIAQPLRDLAGVVDGVLVCAQDRTEETHAREDAEAASRLKDEFLTTLSHELRTPLTAIQLWADRLHRGGLNPARQAHALDAIELGTHSLMRMVDDVLDLSRLRAGRLVLHRERTDPAAPVRAALAGIESEAAARGVAVHAALDPAGAELIVDAARLEQVALNLFSNAVRFTPRGGQVEVSLRRDGAWVELVVADTGRGISQGFLPHVFDPFRQEDASATRRQGGLGLGLALARGLIEQHGGEVAARSEGPGRGATFTVRLPVAGPRELAVATTR